MMACRRVCLADQAYPMNMFIDVYGYGHWIYKIGDGSSGFYIDHTGLAHQLFFWMPMNPEPEWNVIDVIDLSTEEWNDTKTQQVQTKDQQEIQPVQTKEHKTYARICKPASEFDVKKETLSAMIRRVVENEVEMSVKKKLVEVEGKPCYKADCSGCGYSVDLSFKMLHGDCGEYECPKCGNILTCIKLCANKECGNRVFSRPKSRLFPCFKCSKLEKYRDWWELW